MGLFAGSGVGKSTLLSALAKGVSADVVVIGLIGERGRELREFVEETGLTITPAERIAEASQYFVKTTGEAINNLAGFWTASVVKEDPADKSEPDHTLVWIDPNEAAASLRHEAHAWAVLVWIRSQPSGPGNS